MMKDILVLAYAISPTRGSEYSVAWNYVAAMSRYHKLTVLYGTSGDHMGDTAEMEAYIKEHPMPNVSFVAVRPTKFADSLNTLNKKGLFVYSFYFAYNQWHKSVYNVAKKLTKQEHFDLVHYIGPIGYREPGYLWKLDLPYVWGPIGGTHNVPLKLLNAASSFQGKCKLLFRAVINSLQLHYGRRIGKALRHTNVLLTATTGTQRQIRQVHHIESTWLPENGIIDEIVQPNPRKFESSLLHFIWIGSIDERKSLIILLKALQLIDCNSPIVLHIIGDGILRQKMERYAWEHNLDHFIQWHGKISRKDVLALLNSSHLQIISSLSEANTTVIWEAMACGVPTMSLDHCGMHDVICEKCGIKIPIRSYGQVVKDMGFQLDNIIKNPQILKTLSTGVIECSLKFKWENRIEIFNSLYDKAIKEHEKRYELNYQ